MRTLWILQLLVALTTLGVGGTLFAQGPLSTGGPPYQVIVNSSNPSNVVERSFLADAFLKKVTVWSTGDVIRPVDLPPSSPIRRKFTDDIMKRSVEAVKSYWQQHIFAGHDLPPPELSTEDDVIVYVSKHAGAVGYVSSSADLRGAKRVTLR